MPAPRATNGTPKSLQSRTTAAPAPPYPAGRRAPARRGAPQRRRTRRSGAARAPAMTAPSSSASSSAATNGGPDHRPNASGDWALLESEAEPRGQRPQRRRLEAHTRGGGAVAVDVLVADVERPLRRDAQAPQGLVEDPRIRLLRTSVCACDNGCEAVADAEPVEPLVQADVPVRDAGEVQAGRPQRVERLARSASRWKEIAPMKSSTNEAGSSAAPAASRNTRTQSSRSAASDAASRPSSERGR